MCIMNHIYGKRLKYWHGIYHNKQHLFITVSSFDRHNMHVCFSLRFTLFKLVCKDTQIDQHERQCITSYPMIDNIVIMNVIFMHRT